MHLHVQHWAVVNSTAEHWENFLSIEIYCTLLPCTALHCKVVKYSIRSKLYCFDAHQFNALHCVELHFIENRRFAVHFHLLDCTAPPIMHWTSLHNVHFLNLVLLLFFFFFFQALLKNITNLTLMLHAFLFCCHLFF